MTNAEDLWTWVHTPLAELVALRVAEPDRSWPDLRSYFVERTGLQSAEDHPLVDGFLTRLDDLPADERDALLDDSDRLEAIAYEVVTEVAAAETGESPEDSYDEDTWHRFVAEYAPRWSGDDSSWAQFREWFTYHAAESAVGAPATALMGLLDTQTPEQRIATLSEYGVVITVPPDNDTASPAVELTEADVRTLLDQTTDFEDISEDRRRELIRQVAEEQR